jgi:biopolymer transport protein ExbD
MRISRPKLQTAEMDMTPMIDVTFQLIAFFMFVLNFSDVDTDQRINLPLSELAKPPDAPYVEPLTVQMTREDTVLFAGDEMSLTGLQSALNTEAQIIRAHPTKKTSDVTVIIRADKQIRAGRVQEVIEMCQKAEFDTFALRGQQSQATVSVD